MPAAWNMESRDLKPGYEIVFTIADYYDGPVSGIANFQGRPHFYECIFDTAEQEYSTTFHLTPVDPETFQLAMEDWEIWRRWESAFHAGKTDVGTHPALPHEAGRHTELKTFLDRSLFTDLDKAVTRVGQFEVLGGSDLPKGVIRPMQVRWTEPQTGSPPE